MTMKDFPWGYLIGAAVTVLGLLINQRRADKREVDRWQKEVARDEVKWKRERDERQEQWSREDEARVAEWKRDDRRRWIDDQRALYASSLKAGRALLDELSGLESLLELDDEPDAINNRIASSADTLDALDDALRIALSEVVIVASDPVLKAANSFRHYVRGAHYQVRYTAVHDPAKLRAAVVDSRTAYNAYFRSVREDLGISEPLPNAASSLSPDVFDAEFDRALAVARAGLEHPGTEPVELYPSGPVSKELARLTQTAPSAAVVEASGRIEQTLRTKLKGKTADRELSRSLAGLARLALEHGVITDQTKRSIEGMATLRNLAAHGESTTAGQAAEFVNLADGVLQLIR